MDRAAPGPQTEEIVELVFELVERTRAHFEAVAAEFDLTPTQAVALIRLGEPIAMNELATALTCDRSNITGLIDRLEKRRLVRRQTDSTDRRVKTLILTNAGASLRKDLHNRLYTESPTTTGLDNADLAALAALLRKIRDTPEHGPGH